MSKYNRGVVGRCGTRYDEAFCAGKKPWHSVLKHTQTMIHEYDCRALAVGAIAIGSKAAILAKSAGGAGGLLKGAGALLAAGENFKAWLTQAPGK